MAELDPSLRTGAAEEDIRLAPALREGLRCLPVPAVSPGFDSRVLAAHSRCARGGLVRQWLNWRTLRPVLGGAACSLVVMLALSAWSARLPLEVRARPALGGPDAVALDRALARPDLSAASLARLIGRGTSGGTPPAPTPPAQAPAPRPQPGRRSHGRTFGPRAASAQPTLVRRNA
jgi:hypothetical protein